MVIKTNARRPTLILTNEKYYDPSFNGVDWKAVRERYRPRVDALSSDEEFYELLNRMTGELRDAHTRVRSPRQNRNRKNQQATSAGVLVYEVEGTPVVFDVTPDSDAARAGIVPGRGTALRHYLLAVPPCLCG